MATARLARVLLAVLAGVSTLACTRGPEPEDLVAELERRLDSGFEEDLFAVVAFRRRGSAPFHDLERGRSGVFVYYDAELEFLREYELTSWGGLNLGTLAYALGATPAGVSGLEPSGNRRGDRLRVRGRFGFQEHEGRWVPIASDAPRAPDEPVQTLEGTGPSRLLEEVRNLVAQRPVKDTGTRDGAIVYELRRALQQVDLRFARMDGAAVLGTGQVAGTYARFGRAFAEFASQRGFALHAHPTAGSVANALSIQARELDFAVIQSDVAEALHRGIERQQLPLPDLRGVASLWPEVVHLVTLEASGVGSLADLEGRRVAIGQLGSGTRLNAVALGRAIGLKLADLAVVREVSLVESIAELEAGEVDAVFVTEAVPSLVLQELGQRRDDVRFVSIDVSTLGTLALDHFAYYPVRVPARSYPGQDEPFRALGLAAALVTHVATPNDQVARVLGLLLDGTDDLSRAYYRAGFISSETARLGLALPLHPAAERFYAERERAKAGAAGSPGAGDAAPPAR
ncbi:MAG: TAXI family TRAP transporter solute-binding subunit [Myxococcota bacterium]